LAAVLQHCAWLQRLGRRIAHEPGKHRAVLRVYVVEDHLVGVVILDMNPTQGAMPRDTARFLDSVRLEGAKR